MPRRSNPFQSLVGRFESVLHGTIGNVEEPAMVRDFASDTEVEVDVLVTFEVGGRLYRTAVECRDHKRRQGKDWIRELAQKRQDLRLDRIVAASASGFTGPAHRLGQSLHVGIIHVAEATDADLLEQLIPSGPLLFQVASCQISECCEVMPAPPFELASTEKLWPEDFEVRFPTDRTMTLAEVFSVARSAVRARFIEIDVPLQPVSSLPEETDRTVEIHLALVFVPGTMLAMPDGRAWQVKQIVVPGAVRSSRKYLDNRSYFLYGEIPAAEARGDVLGRQVTMTFVHGGKLAITMDDATLGSDQERALSGFGVYYRQTTPGSDWVPCHAEDGSQR